MKVRIKFSKTGTMKYIGHLDVMRYFQKALRRADFDTALSGGFSPHMIMSFAAPLGVGITSEGEYFDLELNSAGTSAGMEAALNAVMAEGISVLSVRRIPDDKKAGGMRLLAAAGYLVRFRDVVPEACSKALLDALETFLSREEIQIEKKTKKGSRVMNIRPLIYELSPCDDGFYMLVSQGSVDNLRPELVMQALFSAAGLDMPENALIIHRLDLYAEQAEPGTFCSLESLGEVIV